MTPNKTAAPPTELARDTPFGSEVLEGLSASPKSLSPWLFYDAWGSQLFEQITELPEYYLTRTERGIFAQHAAAIAREAGAGRPLSLIELGAGTASKTGLLLRAVAAQQGGVDYHAIDVSETALAEAKTHLQREVAGVRVHTRVADYTDGLGRIENGGDTGTRKLVLYIGSSLGNFEPAPAAALLAGVRRQLAPNDALLLGVDLVKDPAVLRAAYNDAAGVTAAFNLNVLRRINRELGANFHLENFQHEALWNPGQSRIEMHLRSTRAQTVSLPAFDLAIRFAPRETIHTENSYKFTGAGVQALLAGAGFGLQQHWSDPRGWFGVYLAAAV